MQTGRHLPSRVIHNAERGSTSKLPAGGRYPSSGVQLTGPCLLSGPSRAAAPPVPQSFWPFILSLTWVRNSLNFKCDSVRLRTVCLLFFRFFPSQKQQQNQKLNWPVPKLATSICIRPFMIHSELQEGAAAAVDVAGCSLPGTINYFCSIFACFPATCDNTCWDSVTDLVWLKKLPRPRPRPLP